jgi:SAM-dependent methyltransferase
MKIFRLRNFDEYKRHAARNTSNYANMHQYESNLQRSHPEKEFTVSGVSYPANQVVDFLVDYQYSDGKHINWRERLICPVTQLNNRLRSCVQIIDMELSPYPDSNMYISEQVTSLFSFLKKQYPDLIGSEYLGNDLKPGETRNGIRHEDMTNLSFSDQSLDYYLSFECFEHIPFYSKAITEIYRTLKPGGYFLGSFPFDRNAHANLIKAKMDDQGNITYLMEPEYHGDPVGISGKGILCYTIFGWEVLDEFRAAGFRDVYAIFLWSDLFGYLGGEQIYFVAQK